MSSPPATFLSLPAEIRNQIYSLLLVLPNRPDKPQAHSPIHPQILRSSRQIHDEASFILYTENVFVAHDKLLTQSPRLRRRYPSITSKRYLPLITRFYLHMRLDVDLKFGRDDASLLLNGLDNLTVEISQAQHGSCGFGNLRVMEAVNDVRQVDIVGSVHAFRGYAAWLRKAMMGSVGDVVEPFSETEEDKLIRVRTYGAQADPWSLST